MLGFTTSCTLLRAQTSALSGAPLSSRSGVTSGTRVVHPRAHFARRTAVRAVAAPAVDVEAFVRIAKESRLAHLESQAMTALQQAVDSFPGTVTFPCALIAGDVVILDLLSRLGYLQNGKVKVGFIDTFHLFPETISFLDDVEKRYGFSAHRFCAAGCDTKADYDAKHGADLWKEDIEEYDRVCKVEPFSRMLRELGTKCMINGRRRDHGNERAHLEVWEAAGLAKLQPLAYWEFRDCFDYLESRAVPAHPLHAQGYPSIGDKKDTVPVAREKWFEYAGERSGRFQGLANKDGSVKTECGIHVDGAERTWDRDLWESGVTDVEGNLAAFKAIKAKKALVVYAPWCQFCQAMESSYAAAAKQLAAMGVTVAKFRGDEKRAEIQEVLGVEKFPSVYAIDDTGAAVKYESEQRDTESLVAFFKDKLAL